MGPGLVTGASDDDPSGIATYSQAGAQYGLALLWTALLTWPLMVAVQEICDRTALATGTGLGELAVKRFGRAGRAVLGTLLVALVVANALNIAADLVTVGSGMQLLHAGAHLDLGIAGRRSHHNPAGGRLLLPHRLGLQVALRRPPGLSRGGRAGHPSVGQCPRAHPRPPCPVEQGVATAQTLHSHRITDIASAAQAAEALKPFAGHFASALFALGFIGSGLLAIPALAGSGSVGMAGLLGKQWGFSRSVRKAPVFYGLVALGTLGGTSLSLLHVNPIKLLVFVAVINGVAAAPFVFVVMWVSSNERLMGDYVNGKVAKVLGWLTATVMAVAAIALFATGGVSL
jgi:Mn2+/Fe2+ NRAMP family transporter